MWAEFGRGDCFGPQGTSPTDFATDYAAILASICAGKPGTVFWVQGSLQNIPGESCTAAAASGFVYGDYRTASHATVTGACPAGCSCHWLDCGGGACVTNAGFDMSGFGSGSFLTDAGLATYESVVATTLAGAGLL